MELYTKNSFHKLKSLANKGIEVIGYDINENFIEICKRKYPKYTFIKKDIKPNLVII